MKLKSMKISPEEMKMERSMVSQPEMPEYPYGLRISLNDETMKKLGIKELPKIGEYFMIAAKACVCSVSQHESTEHQHRHMELQIEDMAVMQEKPDAAKKMYADED